MTELAQQLQSFQIFTFIQVTHLYGAWLRVLFFCAANVVSPNRFQQRSIRIGTCTQTTRQIEPSSQTNASISGRLSIGSVSKDRDDLLWPHIRSSYSHPFQAQTHASHPNIVLSTLVHLPSPVLPLRSPAQSPPGLIECGDFHIAFNDLWLWVCLSECVWDEGEWLLKRPSTVAHSAFHFVFDAGGGKYARAVSARHEHGRSKPGTALASPSLGSY